MDSKEGKDTDKKAEDSALIRIVLCPRNILNCSLAGLVIASLSIIFIELGITLYIYSKGQ